MSREFRIYIRNKKRKGSTANCNYAIEIGQRYHPRYIKVMHQDDSFTYDNSLEQMVQQLENKREAVFVCSGCVYIKEGKKIADHYMDRKQLEMLRQDFYRIIEGNIIGPPSLLLVRNNGI